MKFKPTLPLLSFILATSGDISAQTWSAPTRLANPNIGSGAISGQFSQLLVVNGYPAMADNARYKLRYVRASDPSGTGPWPTAVTVDNLSAQYISLAIINGNPAISYYDQANGDLKYARALDADGKSWGTPVVVDAGGDVGQYTSLQLVNGNPAISYYDVTNGDLKFARANDPEGTDWNTISPISIDVTGNVGQYTSMQIINGQPAIAYYDVTNGDLKYTRSSNANGTAPWPASVVDAAGNVGKFASLKQVNGQAAISYYNDKYSFFTGYKGSLQYIIVGGGSPFVLDGAMSGDVGQHTSLQILAGGVPAISYQGNSHLKFICASNASGTVWNTPAVTIDSTGTGYFTCLQMVNGKPTISYHDQTHFDLKFVTAVGQFGTNWNSPVIHDATGNAGQNISMQIVDGYPAVAYYNGTYDYSSGRLIYVRATDSLGIKWSDPVVIDSIGYAGRDLSFHIINGKPAICYSNQAGDLKYVRANDSVGASWGTPNKLDSMIAVNYTSLDTVNGNPAIVYYSYSYPNGHLKYIRALDASGNNWNPSVPFNFTGDVGQYVSLQIVNQNPAISFFDVTNGQLLYSRSADVNGDAWGAPIAPIAHTAGQIFGEHSSLQIVNGKPAISCYDQSNGDLLYVQATDINGTNPWGPVIRPDMGGDVGSSTSLRIIDGKPAISYIDNTNQNLKYVSASDSNGTSTWNMPSLAISVATEFTSLVSTPDGPAIAYRNSLEELPYFISGRTRAMNTSIRTDYFRTRQNGNWNDVNTWESSPVADFSFGLISPATLAPDFNSDTIIIQNAHTVTITANAIVDETTLENGGAIIVNNGDTLFVNDGEGFDIRVNGSLTVQTGGNMTIMSGIAGTASVGTSAGSITGNVTVERYIPDNGFRGLRLLSVPVTGPQTIKEAWQENGAAVNNLGTQISSNLYNGSNGFDVSSATPSIFIIDQTASGNSYTSTPITNTNTKRLDSAPGYLLLIFGDRNATPANTVHDATTLRSTGSLRSGNQPPVIISSTGPGYTLTGNPYASPIDFESIAGTADLAQYFYVMDAKLVNSLGIGGKLTLVERTGPNAYQRTPLLGVPVVDNSMRYIQSGQAFMLKTTGADANVVFTESSKTPLLPGISLFRPQDAPQQQLLTNLLVVTPDTTTLTDGIRVRFDNTYSSAVTADDVTKMNNFSENLAVRRDNTLLIVEKRPELTINDTIYLNTADMSVQNYRFQISSENMPSYLVGELQDNFTGTNTPIDLNSINYADFSITANPASAAADRFRIVFRTAAALPLTLTSVKAYQQNKDIAIEWNVQNETAVKYYEIEKSMDGIVFNKIATQNATGNNQSSVNYTWIDLHAFDDNNFYRIKSTDLNGNIKYSQVVKINIGQRRPNYQVYPNPLTGNVINFQIINRPKGIYSLRLMNELGQAMFIKTISHNGGNSTQTIQLNKIQKGHYILEIMAPNGNKKSLKIVL